MRLRIFIVLALIPAIWIFSYCIHLYETKDSFKVENINYNGIDSIKINDRGILGTKQITIKNYDTINMLSKMLRTSKIVESDQVNFHSNRGLCYISIHTKNNKTIELTLSKAPYMNSDVMHGILSSGDYQYQNDSLLKFIGVSLGNSN